MKTFARLLSWLLLLTPLTLGAQEAAPGTFEDLAHPLMGEITAAHTKAAPAADEAVIYYYRPDGQSASWGFWLWAFGSGDGSVTWPVSSKLTVEGKVGYLKFKKDGSTVGAPIVGAGGTGVIARKVDGWTKDGAEDRVIDLSVSNEWIIFSGDDKTYPYGAYQPSIDAARLVALDKIQLDLSGRQALTVDPSSNGFTVSAGAGGPAYKVTDVFNTGAPNDRSRNFTKRVTLVLDRPVDLGKPVLVSHPKYRAPAAANTVALAAQVADQTLPPADLPLGATYDPAAKAVTFRVWSPLASAVAVNLYKVSEGTKADASVALAKDPATGVWAGTFNQADPDGWFYDLVVSTPAGTKTALDPWAKAMDVFRGNGPGRGAIVNPARTEPVGGWQGAEDVNLAQREDAVIYEASVRDFTVAPAAGTQARPGSYLAFIEKIPYLKKLGVTHVQLMPVMNFYYNDETRTAFEATGTSSGNNYNWGYDPHNYFTPEGWFATNPADPANRIVELKTLVRELHKAGIGVLLDAVYNHTASTSVLGDVVPNYYYRTTPEGALRNNSGCGNDVASERPMAKRLIGDSIEYWVKEFHVDGFRFDLMGLIDADALIAARARAAALPGKADVLFEGEGWKMYNGPKTVKVMDQTYMTKTTDFSVFNDELRDLLKGGGMDDGAKAFLSNKPLSPKILLSNLLGKPQLNYKVSDPGNNLQYAEAHDNLTMHDNLSNNLGLSDADPAQRAELVARLRLGNLLVLSSQGISFLHSGQESGRSKPKLNSKSEFLGNFIHNSYDAADNINAFNWQPLAEYQGLADFTAGMIGIRKAYDAFRLGDAAAIQAAATPLAADDDLSAIAWRLVGTNGTVDIFVNASATPRTFDAQRALKGKTVLVDQTRASKDGLKAPQGVKFQGNKVVVAPLTAIIVKE